MILITGGAGYIGSHTAINLLNAGKEIVIFDNLENGHIETVEALKKIGKVEFVKGDLRNAFKNLFLICGIVSLTMPILNIIYGGDLIGTVCQKVKIPVSEVNSILATRAQNGEKEFALYEDIDIFDSGPKEPKEIAYNSDVSKSIDNLEKISNEIDAELTAAEEAAAKQSDENSANTETENLDNTVQQEPESQEQL